MHRFPLLAAVALAAVLGVSACGNSDDESSAPPATTQQAASRQPASTDKLAADDAQVLRQASKTVAQYCNGHKATKGELSGAVATVESLFEIDPAAQDASGKTVKQVTTTLAQKLHACGARSAAKGLTSRSG
jgi:hypothetical protein